MYRTTVQHVRERAGETSPAKHWIRGREGRSQGGIAGGIQPERLDIIKEKNTPSIFSPTCNIRIFGIFRGYPLFNAVAGPVLVCAIAMVHVWYVP